MTEVKKVSIKTRLVIVLAIIVIMLTTTSLIFSCLNGASSSSPAPSQTPSAQSAYPEPVSIAIGTVKGNSIRLS